MNIKKLSTLLIVVLLVLTAGGCASINNPSADDNPPAGSPAEAVRTMGFPTLTTVPDGFSLAEAKTIDTGDWCEITYENKGGAYLSLDCYELGTFDVSFLTNYAASSEKTSVHDMEATVYKNISGGDDELCILAWEDANNHALCLLGGNLSLETMLQAAEGIQYDVTKAVIPAASTDISTFPYEEGTIEASALEQCADVLVSATAPVIEQYMEDDSAISAFLLESLYKSFALQEADGLLVEVFDYDYAAKAGEDVQNAGGMVRDENGNLRLLMGTFGQLAVVSRDGQRIKGVPVTGMDVMMEPEGAHKTTLDWVRDNVMTAVKSPSYLMRNRKFN